MTGRGCFMGSRSDHFLDGVRMEGNACTRETCRRRRTNLSKLDEPQLTDLKWNPASNARPLRPCGHALAVVRTAVAR